MKRVKRKVVKKKELKNKKNQKGLKGVKTSPSQKQKQSINVNIDLSKRSINRRPFLAQRQNNPAPLIIQSNDRSASNAYLMNLMNIQQQQLREVNNNLVAFRQREQTGVNVLTPAQRPEQTEQSAAEQSAAEQSAEPITALPVVAPGSKEDLIRRITGATNISREDLDRLTVAELRQRAIDLGIIKPRSRRTQFKSFFP